MKRINPRAKLEMRNLIYGAEDSLVSTVGLLSGIAAAGMSRSDILITGFVLIFVEGFSMAIGSYLSEEVVDSDEKGITDKDMALGGLVMLVSYCIAGLIPLLPYLLLDFSIAFQWSITASLIGLLTLGIISTKFFRMPVLRGTMRMFLLGGLAIIIGLFIGRLAS